MEPYACANEEERNNKPKIRTAKNLDQAHPVRLRRAVQPDEV
jgi:hypothetical protein